MGTSISAEFLRRTLQQGERQVSGQNEKDSGRRRFSLSAAMTHL